MSTDNKLDSPNQTYTQHFSQSNTYISLFPKRTHISNFSPISYFGCPLGLSIGVPSLLYVILYTVGLYIWLGERQVTTLLSGCFCQVEFLVAILDTLCTLLHFAFCK